VREHSPSAQAKMTERVCFMFCRREQFNNPLQYVVAGRRRLKGEYNGS